jgi:peroxiredoxin
VDWLTLGIAVPWIAVVLGAWGVRQFVYQRRRIHERIEGVTEDLDELGFDEEIPGRAIGSEAPAFALPDLEGNQVSSEQFRGRRVLLIFLGPACKFSREMVPGLAALPLDGREGRPELLLASNGTVEENREFVKEFGLGCTVMLQKNWEIASLYAAPGSPMGYMLDERGVLASHLTMGAEDLLALASGAAAASTTAPGTAAQDSTRKGGGKR